jgi:PadR family transcriptional regulator PadR
LGKALGPENQWRSSTGPPKQVWWCRGWCARPNICPEAYFLPAVEVKRTPIDIAKVRVYSYGMTKGRGGASQKTDVLQGTLDLMVLQTLESMGPLHGYGIARRIEQISDEVLKLNEGTVYASLTRLQHQGWISASWGASENNRKAKFYAITKTGRRQLTTETENWERISGVIARLLRAPGQS